MLGQTKKKKSLVKATRDRKNEKKRRQPQQKEKRKIKVHVFFGIHNTTLVLKEINFNY